MRRVAGWIADALQHAENQTRLKEISGEIARFAREFPLFAW